MERDAVRAGVRAAKNVRTSAQPAMVPEGTLLPQARARGREPTTRSVPPASRGGTFGFPPVARGDTFGFPPWTPFPTLPRSRAAWGAALQGRGVLWRRRGQAGTSAA